MYCERCGEPFIDDEKYSYRGKNLCEDCYVEALEPPRNCDVAAVHSAKRHREMAGQSGVEGLTDLQKQVYEYIKSRGKATKQELLNHFKLPEWEIEKQFAILRHCELLKGRKEENKIYIVLFED